MTLPAEYVAHSPVPVCYTGRKEAGRTAQPYFPAAFNLCSEHKKVYVCPPPLAPIKVKLDKTTVYKRESLWHSRTLALRNVWRQRHAGFKVL